MQAFTVSTAATCCVFCGSFTHLRSSCKLVCWNLRPLTQTCLWRSCSSLLTPFHCLTAKQYVHVSITYFPGELACACWSVALFNVLSATHDSERPWHSKMLVWLFSAKIIVYQCPVINYCTFVDTRIWHRDSVGNTAEENSSIFSLIWMP